ncbi:sorbosone dehydrogenase family protein [Pelagerythrobacter marensis]|uniref:Sorbosone dehydrogenase family protein n=1 Tax=Pelagerythrobacter marensis TaxID=543877 RepID=A0ABZ2D4D7_9SPHN
MSTKRKILIWILVLLLALIFAAVWLLQGDEAELAVEEVTGTDPVLAEPESEMVPTVRIAEPVGWNDGEAPHAAEGLAVNRFAEGLEHPRVIHTLPNGDVLVTLTRAPAKEEAGGFVDWVAGLLMSRAGARGESPNQLVLLRDGDGDGAAEQRFVLTDSLDSPSGIAWAEDTLYIANHDALLSVPYELGSTRITAEPHQLMALPAGGNHWMRNIVLDPEGEHVYVAVGSASNIAEKGMEAEEGRAAIWEYDLVEDRQRLFATGLRNPNGLDWNPWSGELWTTVNERDMLGSDLVPDYLTNVPIGAQYGWPWIYWKDNFDRRVTAPMPNFLVEYTRRPEYALGPHVAALGLVFSKEGARMGPRFGHGAFIARHGSWNRIPAAGYDVVYVAFDERGNPLGKPVPVLTDFLTGEGTTRGRPTWVDWAGDGALLVSDDTGGIIWRVVSPGAEPAPPIERIKGTSLPPQRELSGNASATFSDDYARETVQP